MGLFDNYNAINSRSIRPYQGSTVPELVNVAQEMQKRYDTVMQGTDYVSRFMNSMQALPQDRQALREWAGQYKDKLKALSQRPDLENAMRDVQLLAREVPDGYAPFAERIKEQQEFEKGVMENKDLNPDSKASIIGLSRTKYKGMQLDPETGRYVGKFEGYNYMKDIDWNKKVDEYMAGNDPTRTGYSTEQVNGEWIIKQGGKRVTRTPEVIQKIIQSGIAADPEAQGWLRQQEDLGTYKTDFSKLRPEDINMNAQYTTQSVKDPKTGKSQTVPVTTGQMIQAYMEKGATFNQAVEALSRQQISSSWMQKAVNYGMKYVKNDVETESGVKDNPNYRWAIDRQDKLKENQMLQFATTATVGGLEGINEKNAVDNFKSASGKMNTDSKALSQEFSDWKEGRVADESGRTGVRKMRFGDGTWKYKDPDTGQWKDVTAEAKSYERRIQGIDRQRTQMRAIETAAARETGWDKIPKSVIQNAEKAKAERIREIRSRAEKKGESLSAALTEDQIIEEGEKAYMNALEQNNVYRQYKSSLYKRLKGTTMGTDLFTFSQQRSDAIGSTVENMVSGLGLENGIIPVQDKNGQQLSADDWEQLKGKMKAIGVTYTGDPNAPVALIMRAFSDTKGKKTMGEDLIVKLPNTNIRSFIDKDLSAEQRNYFDAATSLMQGLNNSGNRLKIPANSEWGNPKAIEIIPANKGGWKVTVGNKEEMHYDFKSIIDFIQKQ